MITILVQECLDDDQDVDDGDDDGDDEEYEVGEWRVWNLLIPLCPAIKGIPLHLPSIVNCNAMHCNAFVQHCDAMQFKLHRFAMQLQYV